MHIMQYINQIPLQRTSQEIFEIRKKGKARELMFLHAWRSELHSHAWLRSVREANRKEDFNDHIDAFLTLSTGQEIPIQIKGTYEGARIFSEKWNPKRRGIIVVVIGDDYSREDVIFATLYGLDMCRRRFGLDYSTLHQLKTWKFREAWREPKNTPEWFQALREPTHEEVQKYECDAILLTTSGEELPAIVAHNIDGIKNAFKLELRDGICRLGVLVQTVFTKEDIVTATVSAYDALKVRVSIANSKQY